MARTRQIRLPFTGEGLLKGDHALTFTQLEASDLVRGPQVRPADWDEALRRRLVANLRILHGQLWRVLGDPQTRIAGSFASLKGRPVDIDGFFRCPEEMLLSGELERRLDALDPHRAWGWGKHDWVPISDLGGKRKLRMWAHYRVELRAEPEGSTKWEEWFRSPRLPLRGPHGFIVIKGR